MKKLVLIGASGVAHEIIDTVYELKIWDHISIIDDDPAKKGKNFYRGIEVIGGQNEIASLDLSRTEFLLTFSSPVNFLNREEYIASLQIKYPGIQFATIMDPSVYVSETAQWGKGCYFSHGVVLDSNASVSDHCIILFNSVISRYVYVGSCTFISASVNITGGKKIGTSCYLGVKSTINADVGDCVLLSAGSIVKNDVESHSVFSNDIKENVLSYPTKKKMQKILSMMKL